MNSCLLQSNTFTVITLCCILHNEDPGAPGAEVSGEGGEGALRGQARGRHEEP